MIILRGESICNHFWTKPEYYSRYFLSRIRILVAWLDGLYSLLLDVYWSSRILGAPGLDRLKIGISSYLEHRRARACTGSIYRLEKEAHTEGRQKPPIMGR